MSGAATHRSRVPSAQGPEVGGARPNEHPTLRQGSAAFAPPAIVIAGGAISFVAGGGVAPDAMANATPRAEGDSAFRRATAVGVKG